MKIFVDSANIEEIKSFQSLGLVDGVTTNPTLIAKEKGSFKDIIRTISAEVEGPVNAEVVSLDCDGIVKEAEEIIPWRDNIVIKIPMTKEGLKAVNILSKEGIKTNVTLIFTAAQALLAAKAGATYVCPFVGRLDDLSQPGMEIVSQIANIFSIYSENIKTEIIVASIRSPLHVIEAALMGAHIVTIPAKVIEQMFKHPLTDKGVENFLKDAGVKKG